MKWLLIPISMFDLQPDPCVSGWHEFTWKGETKAYHLTVTEDVYRHCGNAMACIKGDKIVVPTRCEKPLAHELNHRFGNHWVDRPVISRKAYN